MDITKQMIPETSYLGKTSTIAIDKIMHNSVFGDTYGALGAYVGEQGITPTGPAVAIYKTWNPEENTTDLMPAFQVAKDTEAGSFELFTVPAQEAYVGVLDGPYSGLMEAHKQIMAKIQEDGVMPKLTVEEYTVGPEHKKEEDCETMDDSKCKTRIIYYV